LKETGGKKQTLSTSNKKIQMEEIFEFKENEVIFVNWSQKDHKRRSSTFYSVVILIIKYY